MGTIELPRPVMMMLGAFSRYHEALDWARDWGRSQFGEVALESRRFAHEETTYYQPQMGTDLKKTFFAFRTLIDPARLAETKLLANQAEIDFASQFDGPESRPLNLDPGYLTDSKFLLATTKDHAHRIYLGQGIYAEITLRYFKGAWQPWEWTYPDYRRPDYREFFADCRDQFRRLSVENE